ANGLIPYDGHIAHAILLDNQALTDSDFYSGGPLDPSGLTFGAEGWWLDFSDNGGTDAANLGNDSSGNANNFTTHSLTTASRTTDVPS
ncbi:MAG TPA: hypothetical protein VKA19_02140, partial [Alphaproteobacteria bacterium]|nr:hypothetical protein [Alphaproteobacteria bacterium]